MSDAKWQARAEMACPNCGASLTPGEALWLRRTRATPDEVFAWFGLDLQPPL